jgi:predicted RND superfamily exporter protein
VSSASAWSWVLDNGTLLGALALIGLVSLVASVLLLPFLVVRIPADYFRHQRRQHEYARERHPAVHHSIVILKNGVGILLILAGIAMLMLPGQGLLTLLIGLMLTDFPGKYRLEKRLIAQPGVLKAVNWLRGRAGHPPLEPPIDGDGD